MQRLVTVTKLPEARAAMLLVGAPLSGLVNSQRLRRTIESTLHGLSILVITQLSPGHGQKFGRMVMCTRHMVLTVTVLMAQLFWRITYTLAQDH